MTARAWFKEEKVPGGGSKAQGQALPPNQGPQSCGHRGYLIRCDITYSLQCTETEGWEEWGSTLCHLTQQYFPTAKKAGCAKWKAERARLHLVFRAFVLRARLPENRVVVAHRR